jgi:hypothetical protein
MVVGGWAGCAADPAPVVVGAAGALVAGAAVVAGSVGAVGAGPVGAGAVVATAADVVGAAVGSKSTAATGVRDTEAPALTGLPLRGSRRASRPPIIATPMTLAATTSPRPTGAVVASSTVSVVDSSEG